MHVADAQREMRVVFAGGFFGQAVSSVLWALSAALSTWGSRRLGMLVLVFGGALIFPATQLILRTLGRRASLSDDNPLGQLAMQIAFTIPLNLLVAGGATLYRVTWFYPACMIVVGAHYLPFVHLYGMRQFWVLGALMVAAGVAVALYLPGPFSLGAWVTAVLLMVFAFVGRAAVTSEPERRIVKELA